MDIDDLLIKDLSPLEFYYTNVDDNEYILIGYNSSLCDVSYKGKIGNILLNFLNSKEEMSNTINKYIDKIKNETDNENLNNKIYYDLTALYEELIKNKQIGLLFHFIDIPKLYVNNYKELYSEYLIYENKRKSLKKNFDSIFSLISKSKGNEDSKKSILSIYNKEIKDIDNKLSEYKNISFKEFTIQRLSQNIELLKNIEVLFLIQRDNNFDLVVNKKILSEAEKEKALPLIYTLQEFDDIICKYEFVKYEKNNISFDIKNKFTTKLIKFYKIKDISDLLILTFTECINKQLNIKTCRNCYKYFIPENRTDEKYCNNISPQNSKKTCKEYGAKKKYRDEIKSQPLKYEHNKTMQFFRMRINRTNNIKEKERINKKFEKYKNDFNKKKILYKANKFKEEDFIKWIIEQKNINKK